MKVTPTKIPEVLLIEPKVFPDERGFFMETWQRNKYGDAGLDYDFVQDNHSRSVKGTLRGLHYQVTQPQGKLVRVVVGEVFDVAVDIRKGSPNFGQWIGECLSAENKRMLFIPPGFAHGFYVTSDFAELVYKCTDYYMPEHERRIRWDDSRLAVDWPLKVEPTVSEKDRQGTPFSEAEYYE
jgi:dTDP-4-dehydrorhamnose 3,5-epimerase